MPFCLFGWGTVVVGSGLGPRGEGDSWSTLIVNPLGTVSGAVFGTPVLGRVELRKSRAASFSGDLTSVLSVEGGSPKRTVFPKFSFISTRVFDLLPVDFFLWGCVGSIRIPGPKWTSVRLFLGSSIIVCLFRSNSFRVSSRKLFWVKLSDLYRHYIFNEN